jgi:subtilisin family serine protease
MGSCIRALSLGLLLAAASLFGQSVSGRYIVEFTTEPAADHVQRTAKREGLRGAAAESHRARIRGEHARFRQRIAGSARLSGARVLDGIDTVGNAVFVEITDGKAAELASLPGVRRVRRVRELKRLLDRAVAVTRVAEAWRQIGDEHAGEGIKIAIIDSGVDSSHPGMRDTTLPMPAGFPKFTAQTDQQYTSSKVIVARSYVNLLRFRDPDISARDRVGHGTALAMVAAGVRNAGPLAVIEGVAPKAYIGNYKVFGTPGVNDGSSDDALLKAIDDAVTDGMDVINLSVGADIAPRLEEDILVDALERATRAGVIVAAAAGNNGPDFGTVSSPATAPSVIAVGATRNDRTFAASVELTGTATAMLAAAGSGPSPRDAVTLPIADVAALDSDGLACAAFPAGRLAGKAALILRGGCTFEAKLLNAQQAGASAAIVYATDASPDPVPMGVGSATLPALMISHESGLLLKQRIAAGGAVTVSLRFTVSAVSQPFNRMTSFSSIGPGVDLSIKPEITAVGSDMYVATQSLDPRGDMYSANGYLLVDGTSFAAPMVAGAAALLKAARPGLTVEQYRSLLINSASTIDSWNGLPSIVQQSGAGQLNLRAALESTATVSPATLGFGAGGAGLQASRRIALTNIGGATETYTLTLQPRNGSSAPAAAMNQVEIAPGAAVEIPLSWQSSGLPPGAHEGFLRITSGAGSEIHVPYWYAASNGEPAHISVLRLTTSGRRGALVRDAVLFRVTDSAGVPLRTDDLEVTVVSGGGLFDAITSYDSDSPGLYGVRVRLGPNAGQNRFRLRAGPVSIEFAIAGQ